MSNDITVSISQDSVQQIVKAKIQAELLGAITKGDGGRTLIEKLVQEALAAKVKRDYREVSFLDDLLTNVIQEETRKAFVQWCEKNRDKIHAAVQKAIEKDKSLTTNLVAGMLNTVQSSYHVKIAIEPYKNNS